MASNVLLIVCSTMSSPLRYRRVALLIPNRSETGNFCCDHCDGVSPSNYEVAVSRFFRPHPNAKAASAKQRQAPAR